MMVNATQLADIYDVDRRTIVNWLNADPPCPSTGVGKARVFDTALVAKWHAERAVREATEHRPPPDIEAAKERKLIADAQLAELQVAQAEGRVIPLDVHEQRVSALLDRLRAPLANMPGTYVLHLERLGIETARGQEVLETVRDAVMLELMGVADDVEADAAADPGAEPEGE